MYTEVHSLWKSSKKGTLLAERKIAATFRTSSPPTTKENRRLPRSWLSFRVQFGRRCLVPSEALKGDQMVKPNAAKNARWVIYLSV
jgi:hypothetical protein